MLNEGKGLILCHVRQVKSDEEIEIEHKQSCDKIEGSSKRLSSPKSPIIMPTENKVKCLKKKIITIDSSKVSKTYYNCSKKLIEVIMNYNGPSYIELYKMISK